MHLSCCPLYQIAFIEDICGKLQGRTVFLISTFRFGIRAPDQNRAGEQQLSSYSACHSKLKFETDNAVAPPVVIVRRVPPISPVPDSESRTPSDPQRSLFWILMSIIGISMPKRGQESRAMLMVIIGALLFVGFIAAAMFTLFRYW